MTPALFSTRVTRLFGIARATWQKLDPAQRRLVFGKRRPRAGT